jgi:hypothetical protein
MQFAQQTDALECERYPAARFDTLPPASTPRCPLRSPSPVLSPRDLFAPPTTCFDLPMPASTRCRPSRVTSTHRHPPTPASHARECEKAGGDVPPVIFFSSFQLFSSFSFYLFILSITEPLPPITAHPDPPTPSTTHQRPPRPTAAHYRPPWCTTDTPPPANEPVEAQTPRTAHHRPP